MSPSAVVLVRNTATNDGRILRAAGALRSLGHEPVILAVTSVAETTERSTLEGVEILRLTPQSPLGFARSLRRLPTGRGDAGREPSSNGHAHRRRVGTPVRLHRFLLTLDYYRRAFGAIRRWKPELVHCNDYNTMWVGIGARLLGSTVVYDSHEIWADRNQRTEPRWWLLACEALFVRLAHRVVTTSPGHAAVLSRRYGIQEPVVVRNIPERGSFKPTGDSLEEGLIAYAGAVTTNRGLEQSIAALRGLDRIRLRVVGPGRAEYLAHLSELARAAGVQGRVELYGAVPPGRVMETISSAQLGLALIQPSCLSYELSLPNKLFEYVAAGLPVVAADLPVIGPFVAAHGIGLLAAPDDPADLASKIETLLEPEINASYREAVRRAQRDLDWTQESRILQGTYREAASARRGPS